MHCNLAAYLRKGAAMTKLLAAFMRNQTGATSIEYAMIASGIAVVIVGAVGSLGSTVKGQYVSVQTALK
jgi:pilus assembly protein Flp/PilA